MSQPLTFRNSKIVYYGPHPCDNCGINIAKMGNDWGGTSFTYPEGPIYPNTEWHPHVCDPFEVRNKLGRQARTEVLKLWPRAYPLKVNDMYVILGEDCLDTRSNSYKFPLVISHNNTFYDTELAAWNGAFERQQKNNPTWYINRYTGKKSSNDDLNDLR